MKYATFFIFMMGNLMLRWSLVLILFVSSSALGASSTGRMEVIPPDDSVAPEIFNGKPAAQEDWPVTLQFISAAGFCTSTIVGHRTLITAAHCVPNKSEAGVLFNNATIVVSCEHHEAYRGGACSGQKPSAELVGCTADVALCQPAQRAGNPSSFKLTSPAGVAIQAETVNTDKALLQEGMDATILGYGCLIRGGPISSVLYEGMPGTRIVNLSRAGASSVPENTLQEYLVVEGESTLCQGDSGGSAYDSKDPGARRVIAINSRGNLSAKSYLTNLSDDHINRFLFQWGKENAAPICGIHPEAQGCR
jgi:trypsin